MDEKEKLEYYHKIFPEIFEYFGNLSKENKHFGNAINFIEKRMLQNVKKIRVLDNMHKSMLGGYHIDGKEILICNTNNVKQNKDTLTHEMLHAISTDNNGRSGFTKDFENKLGLTEAVTEDLKQKILRKEY